MARRGSGRAARSRPWSAGGCAPASPLITILSGTSQPIWWRSSPRGASTWSGAWTNLARRQARSTTTQSTECVPTCTTRSPGRKPAASRAAARSTEAAATSSQVQVVAALSTPARVTRAGRAAASSIRATRRSRSVTARAWPGRATTPGADSMRVVTSRSPPRPARCPGRVRCTSSPGRAGRHGHAWRGRAW